MNKKLNKKLNIGLTSFLALAFVGCNWSKPNSTELPSTNNVNNSKIEQKFNVIELEPTKPESNENLYVAKVREEAGASIDFKINADNFKTLANTNGTGGKTAADIDQYLVYLIKNSASGGYPAGGDPLNEIAYGPFTITNSGSSSKNVRFTNVESSEGDYYYVAVRAQETGPVADIIKDDNNSGSPWGAITAAITRGVAVSTGAGISVSDSLVVTPTTPLSVAPVLLDGSGATIEASITPVAGTLSGGPSQSTISSIFTHIGNGTAGTPVNGGQATDTVINTPKGVTISPNGEVYFVDQGNQRIRKVGSNGIISAFAGSGAVGFSNGGGNLSLAQFSSPEGLFLDSNENLYIADTNNSRVRLIDSSGNLSTVAGSASSCAVSTGACGDGGLAISAQLSSPRDIAKDSSGNIYIADTANNKIRRVDNATGNISTVVGDGNAGLAGDGGNGIAAQINAPEGIAITSANIMFIADTGNHRIRRYDIGGDSISTYAGTTQGFSGDGSAANAAQLDTPKDVTLDSSGNIYIIDSTNNRIRKVDTSGTPQISTIGGNGTSGFAGDGSESSEANINGASRIFSDTAGTLYFSDSNNHRVRKITQ